MILEAKIAVVGDVGCGRTTLCHRLSNPSYVPSGAKARHLDFYFAVGSVTDETSSKQWLTVNPSVALKIVEPVGVDRSSLQSIIFRSVQGLVVTIDGSQLFKESLEGYEMATYVQEMLDFWISVALKASEFHMMFPTSTMPIIVVVSKCDLIPAEQRDAFYSECRTAVSGSKSKIAEVFFVSIVPNVVETTTAQHNCDCMASLVCKLPHETNSRNLLLASSASRRRNCC